MTLDFTGDDASMSIAIAPDVYMFVRVWSYTSVAIWFHNKGDYDLSDTALPIPEGFRIIDNSRGGIAVSTTDTPDDDSDDDMENIIKLKADGCYTFLFHGKVVFKNERHYLWQICM